MPSDDHLWPILVGILSFTNVILLLLLFRRQLLRFFRNEEEASEDEILAILQEGGETGAIEASESQMIKNVLEFNDMTAEDVMIHRTDVVMLSMDEAEDEIVKAIQQSGLSRFPVYQEDADDVVGILSTREYLLNMRLKQPKPLKELLRPAYFVPETVQADVLFRDMQSKKIHMALVVDEYGGTSGLVTLEDLLEELVGNIYDEFDPQDEQEIIPLEENLWRVSGGADLEQMAKEIGIVIEDIDELDYDTLGGLIFAQLSVIPDDGSQPVVEAFGLRVQVEKLCDRRVEWALVQRIESNVSA